jgi:hypothetical protein
MSQTLVTPNAAVASRPKYPHVRSLLVLACIAIIGLTTAVVLVATNRAPTAPRVTGATAITPAPTADLGARLDHSGRREAALSSVLAEPGARLDHSGRREAALSSVLAEPGARLDHRGLHASSQP